jgi:hypothetical protein
MSKIQEPQADAIASKVINDVVGQTLKFSGAPLGSGERDFREKVQKAISKAVQSYDFPDPASEAGLPNLTPATNDVKVADAKAPATYPVADDRTPADKKSKKS